MSRPMRRRFEQGTRPPPERDMADIRRGDKLLAPLCAKISEGDLFDIVEWLRASPIAGAEPTTRALAMMKLRAGGADRETLQACGDVLR